jgi:hypothetical protein
MLNNSF